MNKRIFSILCTVGLLFSNVCVPVVTAVTVEDTPTSSPQIATQSTDDLIKKTSDSSQIQPTQKADAPAQPLKYEDQDILEEFQPESPMPALVFDQKNIENGINIQGKMMAGSKQQETINSETMLNQMILQRTQNDGDWEDIHTFTTSDAEYNLTTEEFPVEFSEVLDVGGNYRYRVIIDYTVNEIEEAEVTQETEGKAQLELGEVIIPEEVAELEKDNESGEGVKPEKEIPEETSEVEPEATPENETDDETAESSVESAETTDEALGISAGINPGTVETLTGNTQIPEIQGIPKEAFQRGMGIMPMASNILGSGDYKTRISGSGGTLPGIRINAPELYSANYTSKSTVKASFRVYWTFNGQQYVAAETPTEENAKQRIDAMNYSVRIETKSGQYWEANNISGKIENDHFTTKTINSKIKSFDHFRRDTSFNIYGRYYPECINTAYINLEDISVNEEVNLRFYFSTNLTSEKSGYNYITFYNKNFADLTDISIPEVSVNNATTANIKQGTYTGDVLDSDKGIVQLSTNGGDNVNYINDLDHNPTISGQPDGTYATGANGRNITGLSPGTKYRAKILLKDVYGNNKFSDPSKEFITPTTLQQPVFYHGNHPTGLGTATATIWASYEATTAPPVEGSDNIDVHYYDVEQDKWENATIVPDSYTVDTNRKIILYTIAGLDPLKSYKTQVRVKNDSGVYSEWTKGDAAEANIFKTRGVALEVSPPTFDKNIVTTSTAWMNSGTYTGNTFTTWPTRGAAKIYISDNAATSWWDPPIDHSCADILNGTYYSKSITGLEVGTQYKVKVSLPDWEGTYIDSPIDGKNGDMFTPNEAKAPGVPTALGIPTTESNATASFEANYVSAVAPKIPAHPSQVEVEVKEEGGTYVQASLVSTPTITTGSNKVSFTVNSLKPNTKYYIQYRVMNDSKAWSNWGESGEFTTERMALTIKPPVFDQDSATSSTIDMDEGRYEGDPSPDGNTGQVYTKSFDNTASGGTTDWTEKISNLTHDITTGGKYDAATITGLDAGTYYSGAIRMKDYDGNFSQFVYVEKEFATKNTVSPATETASNAIVRPSSATVSLSGVYQVGTKQGQKPAHPDKVRVQYSLDNIDFSLVTDTTTPKLASTLITESGTTADFTLEKLKVDTTYYIQYSVENAAGWSEWSDSTVVTTPKAPEGLFLFESPSFNFGEHKTGTLDQTLSLSDTSEKNDLIIMNPRGEVGWTLSAQLEGLKRTDDSVEMPWARLSMKINLEQSTDEEQNWTDYTDGVTGLPRIITLDAGNSSQDLWSISNPTKAKGTFRNKIDWSSVKLDVPGGQQGSYACKLVWSVNSIP